jgi:hypothetical protein
MIKLFVISIESSKEYLFLFSDTTITVPSIQKAQIVSRDLEPLVDNLDSTLDFFNIDKYPFLEWSQYCIYGLGYKF